jgi:hypothetical protein
MDWQARLIHFGLLNWGEVLSNESLSDSPLGAQKTGWSVWEDLKNFDDLQDFRPCGGFQRFQPRIEIPRERTLALQIGSGVSDGETDKRLPVSRQEVWTA